MKAAFIFPAFITNYTGKEIDFLTQNGVDFSKYISQASKVLGEDLPEFSYNNSIYQSDELFSQFIAYLFACAMNDVIREKNIVPDYISGYSMGIYASLYAARSINIEDGLRIIYNAFNLVKDVAKLGNYGMGAVVGLTINNVNEILNNNNFDIEIINVNNKHSIVLAGIKDDITKFLDLSKEEGAMSVNELTVNIPYHSKYLIQYSQEFSDFIYTMSIKDAEIPVVSTFNQKICLSSDDLRMDLIHNLTEKINWYNTMQSLIKLNVNTFYEVGAGKDLAKIARFVEGDYRLISMYKI
jgi:[acyl-carrier-protein] S-malonyltransferase